MNVKHPFSLHLAAAAVAAIYGLASPAFASRNESHPENHAEHHENHAEHHDDHGRYGYNSTSRAYASLSGVVEPGARGKAELHTKTNGGKFEAEVKIPVPSVALAVADRNQAQDAILTLTLSRSGVPYAECDFDLKEIKFRRTRGGAVAVALAEYKIEVQNRRGVIRERFGSCDIDLATAGAQTGLPAVQSGDAAEVAIDTNGEVFLEGVF